jgi:hypothetical protein
MTTTSSETVAAPPARRSVEGPGMQADAAKAFSAAVFG